MPLKDTPDEETKLKHWVGQESFDQTRALYNDFGKPSWFRALAAGFVTSVLAFSRALSA
jgi:hypothetical protein